MELKSGVKTTELWLSLATSIVGILVVNGQLTQEEANAWLLVLGSVIALFPVLGYTISRTVLKAIELYKSFEYEFDE